MLFARPHQPGGVFALADTGRAPFKLLRSLADRRLEGLDLLALLTIDGDGLVTVLHLLFCIAASDYENGTGNLWDVKGEPPPPEGLPTLVKLLSLQFT